MASTRFNLGGLIVLAVVSHADIARADTVVTTYVTKVQEERHDTRWTLTEWLRIKERMRMMDLWLAMFSDPKKDRFQPELNLEYGVTRGDLTLTDASGTAQEAAVGGAQGRAQLWLTNLISGTVGIRTLNVDLGVEGFQRTTGGFAPPIAATDGGASPGASTDAASPRALKHTYYAGALRLFGRNIQDSSLVVKYGEYRSDNLIPQWSDEDKDAHRRGVMAGAELQLYLLKWLGAEGNYTAYGDSKKAAGTDEVRGSYYDYMGFIEISLLRIMVGRYQEDWSFANLGNGVKVSETGSIAGVKLQF